MNQRLTLDVASFQKLLEAVWVLQCERDRELSETENRVAVLAIPSDDLLEPARAVAEAHTSQIEIVDPSVVPTPVTVEPIYEASEVAGALALAADEDCTPLRDPIPFPAPDVFRALSLVRLRDEYEDKEHELSAGTGFDLKRASRVTAAYAGPVVVLLIMFAFLFSLLVGHRPALTAVKAAPMASPKIAVEESPTRGYAGQAHSAAGTGSEQRGTELSLVEPATAGPAVVESPAPGPPALEQPALEPSHLRVTDAAASSLVAGLSRYEMRTVRQQAEYGDAVAALTLGMAYEIGRHVPQSCAQAAHWVAVAAEEGNSAAQYNLALRYLSGDGIPTNLDEARKWLRKAAGRGYQKARLTLQASRL